MKKVITGVIILAFAGVVSARTITVGLDPGYDFNTIQAAINDSNDGDVVLVAPGTYTGDGNRDIDFLGKAVTVRSTDPNDPNIVATTIIDCNGTESEPHRGFYFHNGEDSESVLDGLTITNGHGYLEGGGGIYCTNSSPKIANCVITHNISLDIGGGIFCWDSNAEITGCTIRENRSGAMGGGIVGCGGPITDCLITGNLSEIQGGGLSNCFGPISNCTITHNSAIDGGGGLEGCSGSMTNCNISGNRARHGGGLIYCNGTINNCTIIGNAARDQGGALEYCGGTITNCIIWNNVAKWGAQLYWSAEPTFSCIQDWTGGEHNISEDPCFVAPGAGYWDDNNTPEPWDDFWAWADGDYHLLPSSPCIDTGDPNYIPEPNETDLDGKSRLVDGDENGIPIVDIGAYEFTPSPVIVVSAMDFYFIQDGPNREPQVLQIKNSGNRPLYWKVIEDCNWLEVSPTNGISIDEIDEVTITVEPNGLALGLYRYAFEVQDSNALNSPVSINITMLVGEILRVPDMFATIQAAIDVAYDGYVVIVAPGTYTGDGNRDIDFLGKAITVRSTDPNNPDVVAATVIDCEGTWSNDHCGFVFNSGEDENSILNGLTIRNGGDSVYSGAIHCKNSSPTITNCILVNNLGRRGGVIYCEDSNPTIKSCTISDNIGLDGGGIYCHQSSPLITGCIINGNWALYGGGIYCEFYSNPTITNSVITGNIAEQTLIMEGGCGGGIYVGHDSPTISNCIISGNSAEQGWGGGIYFAGGNPKVINCTITGNSATYGGGSIAACYGLINNCTIVGNAVRRSGSSIIEYCTGTITNCIIWDNDSSEQLRNSVNPIYSCIEGWTGGGEHNISEEPCFVEYGSGYWDDNNTPDDYDDLWVWTEGDYHLLANSPCIDTGDPNFVPEPNETDLDGNPRVMGPAIDMGAYEYEPPIPADVDIEPDTLNLASKGNWLTCYIWLPADYNVTDIDPNSVLLEDIIPAERSEINNDAAIVKFSRSAVQGILSIGENEITLTGELLDGTIFEGTDIISVIDKGGKKK